MSTINQITVGSTTYDIEDTTARGRYEKPSTGIPKTDLAAAVQSSLNKADTALQSFTETDPTVPSWAKADTKPTYTATEVGAVPMPTSGGNLSADVYVPTVNASNQWYKAAATTTPASYKIAKYESGGYLMSTTPSSGDSSTKVATTSYVQGALANRILYYSDVACSVGTGDIATVSNAAITTNHVVAQLDFASPSYITTDVNWTTSAGSLVLSGTCTNATTANILLVLKDN